MWESVVKIYDLFSFGIDWVFDKFFELMALPGFQGLCLLLIVMELNAISKFIGRKK